MFQILSKKITAWRLLACLCAAVLCAAGLSLPVFADEDEAPVIKVAYYENEIFQEGAAEGKVKTGYSYEYYRKLSEYTGWKYEYVYGDFSDLYEQFLNSIGHVSLRESERIINNPAHPLHARFASLASRCIESNDWAYNKIENDGKTIVVRMKPISAVPGCDEIALLAIVDEVLDVDAEVRVI